MKNLRLSASMIKDYIACHRKAYYRLYSPEQSMQTHEQALGSLIHKVIEDYWNDKDKALKELKNLYVKYNLKRDYHVVEECLESFYSNYSSLFKEDSIIEKYFTVKYSNEVSIVGKMDLISENNIFDWKTGLLQWSKPVSLTYDVQAILYDYAYQKMFNVIPNVYYVYLRSMECVEYKRNFEANAILFETVIPNIIESIKARDFTPNGLFGYKVCSNCSFVEACYKDLRIED